jgi:hypothetical protein
MAQRAGLIGSPIRYGCQANSIATTIRLVNPVVSIQCDGTIGMQQSSLPTRGAQWREANLNDDAFNGRLPNSVGEWTNVQDLLLQGNRFTGTLPESIGNWRQVTRCQMQRNDFSRSLPSAIGQWTSILSVNLSRNALSGTIPSSVGDGVEWNWSILVKMRCKGRCHWLLVNGPGCDHSTYNATTLRVPFQTALLVGFSWNGQTLPTIA